MKLQRDSSIELFRIITMLMIVAHHYVVNSGVMSLIAGQKLGLANGFLLCMGAWGKVGINCFVLITGYFMCEKSISLRKFLKLYLEIVFYSLVLNAIFALTGYTPWKWRAFFYTIFPIRGITSDHFTGAYLVFFLTIPFLTILVKHLTQKQHLLLLALLIPVYTIFPFVPGIVFAYNHVEWFAILFFIGAYLRKYPNWLTESRRFWGWMSLAAIVAGVGSVLSLQALFGARQFSFLADSNKFTALACGICFFLYFKNLKLGYSRVINGVASTAFGVLLIHANSAVMRRWLWQDVCSVADVYRNAETGGGVPLHCLCCVVAIYLCCSVFDIIRQRFVEKPIFRILEGRL